MLNMLRSLCKADSAVHHLGVSSGAEMKQNATWMLDQKAVSASRQAGCAPHHSGHWLWAPVPLGCIPLCAVVGARLSFHNGACIV